MAAFSLTKGGKTFDFEPNGEVKRSGNLIGTWSTTNDDSNQLVVTESSGALTNFNVAWRFNPQNQLEVHRYAVIDAVAPDISIEFPWNKTGRMI